MGLFKNYRTLKHSKTLKHTKLYHTKLVYSLFHRTELQITNALDSGKVL